MNRCRNTAYAEDTAGKVDSGRYVTTQMVARFLNMKASYTFVSSLSAPHHIITSDHINGLVAGKEGR